MQQQAYWSDGDIASAVGIQPYQQICMLTQELLRLGRIRGEHRPGSRVFWAGESPAYKLACTIPVLQAAGGASLAPQA